MTGRLRPVAHRRTILAPVVRLKAAAMPLSKPPVAVPIVQAIMPYWSVQA